MKNITTTIKNVWNWLVKSSANPENVALTVKGFASYAGVQIFVSNVLPLLGVHLSFDFNSFMDGLSSVAFYSASIISFVAGFIGAIRKIRLTVLGQNA